MREQLRREGFVARRLMRASAPSAKRRGACSGCSISLSSSGARASPRGSETAAGETREASARWRACDSEARGEGTARRGEGLQGVWWCGGGMWVTRGGRARTAIHSHSLLLWLAKLNGLLQRELAAPLDRQEARRLRRRVARHLTTSGDLG